jgi:hypothetical protein
MIANSILVSVPIGVLEAELVFGVFLSQWVHAKCDQIGNILPTFLQTSDDDARQALIFRAGAATLQFGLAMFCAVALMSIIAYIPSWLLAWDAQSNFMYMLILSIVVTVWVALRQKWRQAALSQPQFKYTALERSLHWIALELKFVREISFDLEKLFFLPQKTASTINADCALLPSAGPVYVTGMARSGTTLMLNILEELDDFRSLTYRDMPFVLAPNLWKTLTCKFHVTEVKKERAHNDGVLMGFDSPEALEEVFWQTYSSYKRTNQSLVIKRPSVKALAKFAYYRAVVANPKSASVAPALKRYLSKNNNNLVRLIELGTDPTATTLLIYRDPVAMASSLYQQHRIFSEMHREDSFSKRYMTWLAHHEFGLVHLPFSFALPEMDESLSPDNPNYWLSYWNAVHLYILAQSDARFYLIDYNVLCKEPKSMLQSIFALIGVYQDAGYLVKKINEPRKVSNIIDELDSELLKRAKITYSLLLSSSKNIASSAMEIKL